MIKLQKYIDDAIAKRFLLFREQIPDFMFEQLIFDIKHMIFNSYNIGYTDAEKGNKNATIT